LCASAASASADSFSSLSAISVGAAGLGTLVADPASFAASLRSAAIELGAPGDLRVGVAVDAVVAHLGALGGETGAVIALGTGAIALGGDGASWRRVDGWGHLLGDRGSGAWVGMAALRVALRAFDGVDDAGAALLGVARKRFGEPFTWPGQLYTRDDRAAVLAGMVPEVLRLAEMGDGAALDIARRAGADAAQSVVAAATGYGSVLSGTGRLLTAGSIVARAFEAEVARIAPWATLRAPVGSPLDGALLLAERLAVGAVSTVPGFVWTAEPEEGRRG
jgi:N-acetylglucosamine kinase-like BadF-type ATPase